MNATQNEDIQPDKEATGACKSPSSTVAILPVKFQSDKFIVMEHFDYEGCEQKTECPYSRARSVFSIKDNKLILHSYRPYLVKGTAEPDFATQFVLIFDITPSNCCNVLKNVSSSAEVKRRVVKYDPRTSRKFVQYSGIDVCVWKYMGTVLVLAEDKIVDPCSEVVKLVEKCAGLQSIDQMFEAGVSNSKHVLHFTLCLQHHKCNKYTIPVVGDFMVFKYFTVRGEIGTDSTSKQPDKLPEVYAGRIKVESILKLDHTLSELGGDNSKLIGQSPICNWDAKMLWRKGCGILVQGAYPSHFGVVIKRAQ